MSEFRVGQRWISNTEATLGLGIITELVDRRINLSFPAAQEERAYAASNAPLSRIVYKIGDAIKNIDGDDFTIIDILDHHGLMIYKVLDGLGEEQILPEIELDCFVHFNSPKDRLFSGLIDPIKFFALRHDARESLRDYQQSNVVGLLGPRVQLLPHQLYIAKQVAGRKAPRVLLADEVGLGKTIEAGLIVHQQLQAGLAERVLILVPDSLLHQWLVEMLRRFNLNFSVLDEEICAELLESGGNPFESAQRILCPLSFVANSDERLQQALACDWDLLLVDEAHHLKWQPGQSSFQYQAVEALAQKAHGVLLLTATPEQLGVESHFARLRLLDPDRYYSLEAFLEEDASFQVINQLIQEVNASVDAQSLPEALIDYLLADEYAEACALFAENKQAAIDNVLDALIDRHGTGRVMFRNTRAAVKGFAARQLHSYPLMLPESDLDAGADAIDCLQIENLFGDDWLILDARIPWLVDFLRDRKSEKVLLICAQAETAIALESFLRLKVGVRTAVFHEGMSLIARDRAAAYFADSDDAAQMLVCSEIGSEGRNFQFAHDVIMFDLPINPDLLEQRIGRLDRIGQLRTVNIHVPYYENTAQEVLLDWYHEGLNAFELTSAIGQSMFEKFEERLINALESHDIEEVQLLIEDTATQAEAMRLALQQGRDQLLELHSCRPKEAADIIDAMLHAEKRLQLEDFIERCCDQFGIELETHSSNAIILRPGDHMRSGGFSSLKEDGFTATFSRENALSREDMQYLSWEHPFVQSAFDEVLYSEHGNTAVATVKLKPLKEGTLLLEALFSVEAIAPKSLGLSRYLPASTIRVLVNLDGKDFNEILPFDKLNPLLQRLPLATAQALVKQARERIEELLAFAEVEAAKQLPEILAAAKQLMNDELGAEIHRLNALAEVNALIGADEVKNVLDNQTMFTAIIDQASFRLDALRVIMAV